MSDVKWIKIVTNIFDDEKITLIEQLPECDSIIVIWFKLLCLAGKQNNGGVFLLNDKIAYTDKMLAAIFRRKESTVQFALKSFEELGMIEIIDNVYTIPNWSKHQTLDAYEKKLKRDKEYQAKRRLNTKNKIKESLKELPSASSDKSSDESPDVVPVEEDIRNKIKEEEGDIIVSDETISNAPDVERFISEWNSLEDCGINQIMRLGKDSKRYKMLLARISEYGEDVVLEAIRSIRYSDFLKGKNDRGWTVTFDWFVLPNNFPKVIEGNYANKNKRGKRNDDLDGIM